MIALVLVVAACGGGPDDQAVDDEARAAPSTTSVATTPPSPPSDEGCAHVIDATALRSGDGTWTFSATVRSADTGEEKYADAWEVRTPAGGVLGRRVLAHPHVAEQPFTRSLRGVQVPAGVTEVEIAASDSVLSFCGDVFRLTLDP